MKREIPGQLVVAAIILVGGGALVGGEYLLVRWYPRHALRVREATLKRIPYSNTALGIEMQVAAGIYKKELNFRGGVKLQNPRWWGVGPSLTITSQPNLDKTTAFPPELLAKWQTQGVYQEIPRYRFEHTKINERDAVLTWQLKGRSMVLSARVLSPERIIEADCTPGRANEALFLQACEESLRTLKIPGAEPPSSPTQRVEVVR